MARLPHPPSGTRFFARMRSAVLECPRCGRLLEFGYQGHNRNCTWDARTSRLTCGDCNKVLLIGLLAWPVQIGGRGGLSRPRDQVPSERQLAELRAQAGGLWQQERKRGSRPDDTNITAACTCRPGTDGLDPGWVPTCPIHGDLDPDSLEYAPPEPSPVITCFSCGQHVPLVDGSIAVHINETGRRCEASGRFPK